VRLPEGGIAPAAADELRLAFKHFRGSGKKVVVHSQGLYPSGIVTSTYMLGASGDELWMQPGAPFQVTGLASEEMFFSASSTNGPSNPTSSSAISSRPRSILPL